MKLIRRISASIGEPSAQIASPIVVSTSEDEIYRRVISDYEKEAVEEEESETVYESDEEVEACGCRKADPKNLEERLELLILKTKSGYYGLYEKC